MTIIPSAPLVVNVARHGGLLGRSVSWQAVAEPASAIHDAALALLRLGPPDDAPTRNRDGFTYAVTIAGEPTQTTDGTDAAPLLDARFHDPAPDALAGLLTLLAKASPQG